MKDVEMIEQIKQIDWWYVLVAIILALIFIKSFWTLFDWFVFNKLGIETRKMKEKRQDRELLNETAKLAKATSENLDKLEKRHIKDEADFRNSLSNYITENRKDLNALYGEMTKFTNNRISDRKQSLEIQKELRDAIAARDIQIESVVVANKEMLAEKINEKYKYYISINGIPEDEYDEFVSLHDAYNGVGGNHNGDAKFEYCIKHLPIIPVDTKLVIKHNKD